MVRPDWGHGVVAGDGAGGKGAQDLSLVAANGAGGKTAGDLTFMAGGRRRGHNSSDDSILGSEGNRKMLPAGSGFSAIGVAEKGRTRPFHAVLLSRLQINADQEMLLAVFEHQCQHIRT
jgi:hypothetical protein